MRKLLCGFAWGYWAVSQSPRGAVCMEVTHVSGRKLVSVLSVKDFVKELTSMLLLK
jgi:apolipoprotein N-acyltransferase